MSKLSLLVKIGLIVATISIGHSQSAFSMEQQRVAKLSAKLDAYKAQATQHINEQGPVGDAARAFLPRVNKAIDGLNGTAHKFSSPADRASVAEGEMGSPVFKEAQTKFENASLDAKAKEANPTAVKALQQAKARTAAAKLRDSEPTSAGTGSGGGGFAQRRLSGEVKATKTPTLKPAAPQRKNTKEIFTQPQPTDPQPK